MTDPAIVSKIIQALASYLKRDPASITEAHHLRDDLGLDSMAVIELLFEIEERFKIQIPDQDLPALTTVGSVAIYVQERLVPAKPASSHGSKKAHKAQRLKKTARTPKSASSRLSKKPASTSKKKKR